MDSKACPGKAHHYDSLVMFAGEDFCDVKRAIRYPCKVLADKGCSSVSGVCNQLNSISKYCSLLFQFLKGMASVHSEGRKRRGCIVSPHEGRAIKLSSCLLSLPT